MKDIYNMNTGLNAAIEITSDCLQSNIGIVSRTKNPSISTWIKNLIFKMHIIIRCFFVINCLMMIFTFEGVERFNNYIYINNVNYSIHIF